MDLDKTHGDEITSSNFNYYYIKELENWIKSMYLLPEEFEFQRRKVYNKVKEQILQESGW
jgi:hypothetical protein